MRTALDGIRVVVAEDDPSVRQSLEVALRYAKCVVESVADGAAARNAVERAIPDLLLLDVMMPKLSGIDLCHELRAARSDLPILMVTARDDIADRVVGLDAGADDYIVKPFSVEELLARCAALVRRTGERGERRAGPIRLDQAGREASIGERALRLTRTEFDLLWRLAASPGHVVSREMLTRSIWGDSLPDSSRSLDVYVSYLRRKLEGGGEPRIVHTERGVGFRLGDI